MKYCSGCKKTRPETEFWKARSRRDGLQALCKECKRDLQNADRAKTLSYSKKWYRENYRAWYQKSKARVRERQRLWQNANRDHIRQLWVVYGARRRSAGSVKKSDVQNILQSQAWACVACRGDLRSGYHVDHIVAISNGGSSNPDNLQALCPDCNMRKSDKDFAQFMAENGFQQQQ